MEPQTNTVSYDEMLGMANAPADQPTMTGGMQAITDPAAGQALAAIEKPVQTPAELEARKTGWQTVAERLSNPNLLRAIGFAGAAMARPGASWGHGLASGMTAFQAGEYDAERQALLQRTMKMKESESAAEIEQRGAQTANTRAALPGIQARGRVETETADAQIKRFQDDAEAASLKLKSAKNEEEVAEIERGLRKRRAEIEKSVPDKTLRAAIFADYDKAIAQASAARAKAKKDTADADLTQREVDLVKNMDDKEFKDWKTRSGKYSGTQSAVVQQAELWGRIYDGIKKEKPDDPSVKGKTRDQFMQAKLTEAKQKDALELYIKAKAVLSDEEIDQLGLRELAVATINQRGGEEGAKGSPAGGKQPGPWQPLGTDKQMRQMPDGTMQVRRKPSAAPSMMNEMGVP